MSTQNTPLSQSVFKADLDALEQRLMQQFERQREYIDECARDMQTELLRAFQSTADVSNSQSRSKRHESAAVPPPPSPPVA